MGRAMGEKNYHIIWPIIVAIGVIFGIIVSFLYFEDRIVTRIIEKLKTPEVTKQIALLIRPSVIFDQNGTITHNSGGAQFIKDIKVELSSPEKSSLREPQKILIFLTEHLNVAPILECLNYSFFTDCKRINKSDWQCELSSHDYIISKRAEFAGEWRFRLEIIR